MHHNPLKSEQRRQDMQKWVMEGAKQPAPVTGNTMPLIIDDPLLLWAQEQFETISNWAADTYGSKTIYRSKAYLYPGTSNSTPLPGVTIKYGTSHSIVESIGEEKPIVTFIETDQDQKSKIGVYNSVGDFKSESGIKDTNSRLFFSEIPSKVFYNQYSYSHDKHTDSLSLMTNGLEFGIGIYSTNHIDNLEEVSYTEIMINKVDIIATILFYVVTQGAGSPAPIPSY